MTTKNDKSGVERSRLTLLLGMTAAAGSGGCLAPGLQNSPDPIADSMRMRPPVTPSSRPATSASRAPAAPSPDPNGVGPRDPAGNANAGGGGGGSGGSY